MKEYHTLVVDGLLEYTDQLQPAPQPPPLQQQQGVHMFLQDDHHKFLFQPNQIIVI